MHHVLILALLGVFSLVWADNAPLKPDAVQRDAKPAEMVTPPPQLHPVHTAAQLEGRQAGSNIIGYAAYSGYCNKKSSRGGGNEITNVTLRVPAELSGRRDLCRRPRFSLGRMLRHRRYHM